MQRGARARGQVNQCTKRIYTSIYSDDPRNKYLDGCNDCARATALLYQGRGFVIAEVKSLRPPLENFLFQLATPYNLKSIVENRYIKPRTKTQRA